MDHFLKKQLSGLTDEELMGLYQAGNYAAFETLYYRQSSKVYQYLRYKVPPDVAQDLMQEIFVKIHRFRNQYSNQYPLLPWIFTISRNTLFDYFKSNKASKTDPVFSSEVFEQEEVDLNLTSVLVGISENQRRAIELRYLADWSFEKIADDMQTTPENVRQLISRGIKKVKSLRKGFL
jgi:RNA polymerase sigma factor (sigma-70 family)